MDQLVLREHLRWGEDEGAMLDCIYKVLTFIGEGSDAVVVFCNHGKVRTARTHLLLCARNQGVRAWCANQRATLSML